MSIAVHWNSYYGGDLSNIPAATPDGIRLPDGSYNNNWTNIESGWYGTGSGNNTNLKDNAGTPTAAAVTTTTGASSSDDLAPNVGSYWGDGHYASGDTLLNGPWGGDGAVPNVITGIPYAHYEIVGYTNPPFGPGGDFSVWLDGNPTSSNAANAPLAGSEYYFSTDNGSGTGLGLSGDFDVMTDTNPGLNPYPSQNTVVWTGLTGADQTLWTEGFGDSENYGFTGFEIVDTPLVVVSEPSGFAILGAGAVCLAGLALGGCTVCGNATRFGSTDK
jgi:hypothetical protein